MNAAGALKKARQGGGGISTSDVSPESQPWDVERIAALHRVLREAVATSDANNDKRADKLRRLLRNADAITANADAGAGAGALDDLDDLVLDEQKDEVYDTTLAWDTAEAGEPTACEAVLQHPLAHAMHPLAYMRCALPRDPQWRRALCQAFAEAEASGSVPSQPLAVYESEDDGDDEKTSASARYVSRSAQNPPVVANGVFYTSLRAWAEVVRGVHQRRLSREDKEPLFPSTRYL